MGFGGMPPKAKKEKAKKEKKPKAEGAKGGKRKKKRTIVDILADLTDGDAESCENACECLHSLLAPPKSCNDRAARAAELGAIVKVINAMSRHHANRGLVDAALDTLHVLARNGFEDKAAEAGGVPAIVAAMDAYEEDAEVQESACNTLHTLLFRSKERLEPEALRQMQECVKDAGAVLRVRRAMEVKKARQKTIQMARNILQIMDSPKRRRCCSPLALDRLLKDAKMSKGSPRTPPPAARDRLGHHHLRQGKVGGRMAGASDMSRRDLERESGTEGGRGGDEGSLAKAPPSSSARAVFDAAECAAVEALRATGSQCLRPTGAASCVSSSPATGATAAAAVSAGVSEACADTSGAPAVPAAAMHALAARAGQAARFKFADLLAATGNFEKQLGAGGSGSVFQGTLKSSATQIAVKKLEFAAGSEMQVALAHMQTEVQVLSQVTHPNIVPLLGWSNDGEAPCLVYALAAGGSLQDRLMCRENGAPLTSKERILVLSDVLRALAYLHAEVRVIHRDVKSANVLIDHGCVGRIGDFGIARSVRDNCGVTATQLQTQAPMGTTIYMSPESMRGELSYKVDSFAFGLVMIETLTGLPVLHPAAGRSNLHSMFEEDMDTAEEFLKHLDTRARWEPHTSERIPLLYSIAARCLEPRPKGRAEVVDLIPEFEKVRCDTEALDTKGGREQVHGKMGDSEVPDAFCCPILLEIMSDPVMIETGHTFERSAIEDYLKRCNRGPLCGVQLKSKALMPNFALRQAIEAYLSERGQAAAPSAPEHRGGGT